MTHYCPRCRKVTEIEDYKTYVHTPTAFVLGWCTFGVGCLFMGANTKWKCKRCGQKLKG